VSLSVCLSVCCLSVCLAGWLAVSPWRRREGITQVTCAGNEFMYGFSYGCYFFLKGLGELRNNKVYITLPHLPPHTFCLFPVFFLFFFHLLLTLFVHASPPSTSHLLFISCFLSSFSSTSSSRSFFTPPHLPPHTLYSFPVFFLFFFHLLLTLFVSFCFLSSFSLVWSTKR
jgi:hypothetical protein